MGTRLRSRSGQRVHFWKQRLRLQLVVHDGDYSQPWTGDHPAGRAETGPAGGPQAHLVPSTAHAKSWLFVDVPRNRCDSHEQTRRARSGLFHGVDDVRAGSECFAIQDDDRRNACLASLKSDKSYCYKITNAETREGCLAPLKEEPGYFKIANADARAACLGETKREPSYCYKVQDADGRYACLAEVKVDRRGASRSRTTT